MIFATKTAGEAMPVYDAVVIGSGYGGGVAASRLARMGLRLALLEQGRLWRPGDFPITGKARLKALRLTGRAPKLGDPAGLYYLSVGKGLTYLAHAASAGGR
jgi:cholesterol oxidase